MKKTLALILLLAGLTLEAQGRTLTWTGAVSNVWDTTTANWLDEAGNAAVYVDGDNVVFDDSASMKSVSLAGDLSPASVTVNNSEGDYFTSNGKIIGDDTTLVKEGTGGLIMGVSPIYGGMTTIKAGMFSCSANNLGPVTLEGGTLYLVIGTFKSDITVTGSDTELGVASEAVFAGSLTLTSGSQCSSIEDALTITGDHKLTAGKDARLNAILVMGGSVGAPAVLDVSANLGDGGLEMGKLAMMERGSTVTLNPGSVLLSDADMDAIGSLDFMGKYDLFNGVDGLSLGGDFLSELGLADKWVKAADVFANEQFEDAEKDYYLFYSGVNRGGVGGNVGTVYLMQIPEPTTGTLSLLALAALAARRRRK